MSTRDVEIICNNSLLHIAVQKNDVQAVETLLADKAKLEARNSKGRTPLHEATNYKIVKDLLTAGADMHARDKNDNTPLHTAVIAGCVPVVQLHLQAGANVTLKNSYKGDTPLHLAVTPEFRHATMAQLLVKSGALVNEVNNFTETSLHLASKNKTGPIDRNIVKLLLDNGADIHALNCAGQKAADQKDSPLHDAAAKGDVKAIDALLKLKNNVNVRNIYGKTPIFEAVSFRGIEPGIIRALTASGADVTLGDAVENTPLHESVLSGNISIVRLLLNAGAQVNKQDAKGDTALHCAVKCGYRKAFKSYTAIVKVLIDSGADLSLKNNEDKIAADYAKLDSIKKFFV